MEESVVGDVDERLLLFLADPQRAWEVLNKLQVIFYTDPMNATLRAIAAE